jgi:hypothetical protein
VAAWTQVAGRDALSGALTCAPTEREADLVERGTVCRLTPFVSRELAENSLTLEVLAPLARPLHGDTDCPPIGRVDGSVRSSRSLACIGHRSRVLTGPNRPPLSRCSRVSGP